MTFAPQIDFPTLIRSNSLAVLAARVRAAHTSVDAALKDSLTHALDAGDLLIEAKAQIPHGQWLSWLQSCGVSERSAQRYIRLARNRARIEAEPDTVSDLSINAALALLVVRRQKSRDPAALLAEGAAETAFETFEIEEFGEGQKRKTMLEQSSVALDKIITLATTSGLSDIVDRESEDFFDVFIQACREFTMVAAADAEDDGLGQPIMSPAAAASKVRDIVNEWLRRVNAATERFRDEGDVHGTAH
jgi:hypothetical protein